MTRNEPASAEKLRKLQMMKEYITDVDQLYVAMMKCKKGVSWKPTVKSFVLNSEENLLRMQKQHENGAWKNGKTKTVLITYPKRREALSIPFKDRVYQRSINDNALYPQMTRGFIYANCACQAGKGTDFARKLIKKYLWNYYCNNGTDGWVVQIDVHGYYLHMRHEDVESQIEKAVDVDTAKMACEVLRDQYAGTTGYNPGSQMVQIAGIALLNKIDHRIKEQLHVKKYIRYMDDLWALVETREKAEEVYNDIKTQLKIYGLTLNEKKSHITSLRDGFLFLGFYYRITETGKIIMTLNPESTKHERKTVTRMIRKEEKGELREEKIKEHHASWENNASKGNTYKMRQRTNEYIEKRRGNENGNKKNESDACRTGGGRKPPGADRKAEADDRKSEGNDSVFGRDDGCVHPGRNRGRGGDGKCTEFC